MSDHKDGAWMHDFQATCKKGHDRNSVWADSNETAMTKVSARCVYCGGEQKFTVKKYWQAPTRAKYFKIR